MFVWEWSLPAGRMLQISYVTQLRETLLTMALCDIFIPLLIQKLALHEDADSLPHFMQRQVLTELLRTARSDISTPAISQTLGWEA